MNKTRDELILDNMGLVYYVAKSRAINFQVSEDEENEMIGLGNIGLIKAADSFNPDLNYKFSTWAIPCINNEINYYYRANKNYRMVSSFEVVIHFDEELGIYFYLSDTLEANIDIERDYIKKIEYQEVREILNEIPSTERSIIEARYGFIDGVCRTQKEVEAMLGLPQSYISRVEKKAKERIKKRINLANRY